MQDNIQKGRTLLRPIIGIPIGIGLMGIACRWPLAHTLPSPGTLIGFTTKVLLFWFLYRGHAWARWLMGALFGVSGLAFLPIGLMLLRLGTAFEAPYLVATGLAAVFCGAFNVVCAAVLFSSRNIREFLAYQAQRRRGHELAQPAEPIASGQYAEYDPTTQQG